MLISIQWGNHFISSVLNIHLHLTWLRGTMFPNMRTLYPNVYPRYLISKLNCNAKNTACKSMIAWSDLKHNCTLNSQQITFKWVYLILIIKKAFRKWVSRTCNYHIWFALNRIRHDQYTSPIFLKGIINYLPTSHYAFKVHSMVHHHGYIKGEEGTHQWWC